MKKKMYLRPSLRGVEEYTPGKSAKGAIKLSSNENPLGPSPKVIREIVKSLEEGELELNLYPKAESVEELKKEISRYVCTEKRNIVIGAGVDDVLEMLVKIFIENGDEAIIPIPTFSLYDSLVKIAGGIPRYIKRRGDFSITARDVLSASTPWEKTRMIFLCSPNNPTGNCIPEDEVRMIAESVDYMIVIDEAYVEFSGSSLVKLVKAYENVLVVRTFSKAFGLAGLRVGYGVIPEWLVEISKKVSLPFSVNSIAINAAIAALRDKDYLRRSVEMIKEGREFLLKNLSTIFKVKVFPSSANFVLLDVSPRKSSEVFDALMKKGIIVRDCSSFKGAGDSFIRISVGTRAQNEKVVEALEEVSAFV